MEGKANESIKKKKNTKQDRTIYLRFPKRITDIDEVRNLITGDANIKLRRQASRHCHVIFPKMEQKINNMKSIKAKSKENKLRIVVSGVKPNQKILQSSDNDELVTENKKVTPTKAKDNEKNVDKQVKQKSIKPKLSKAKKRAIIVRGISKDTPLALVKEAFPDCKTFAYIKDEVVSGVPGGIYKRAVVKFDTAQTATEYLTKKRTWPLINGKEIEIKQDLRKKTNAARQKKLAALKIKDDETNNTSNMQLKKKNDLEVDGTSSGAVIKMENQSDNDAAVVENLPKKEKK